MVDEAHCNRLRVSNTVRFLRIRVPVGGGRHCFVIANAFPDGKKGCS